MSIRVADSSAPHADSLIGRATGDVVRALMPAISSSVLRFEALIRGRRWLAEMDRAFDVTIDGRRDRLRAFDAINGCFMIHLGSTHVAFRGDEVVVRTHAHAPDAPVGFYNARVAKTALEELAGVLDAAIADRSSGGSETNRIRARNARERVGGVLAELERMIAAMGAMPMLARLEEAAAHAYAARKPGDESVRKLAALREELEAWRAGAALDPELARTFERDLETIAADQEKWLAYHAPTLGGYYASRNAPR